MRNVCYCLYRYIAVRYVFCVLWVVGECECDLKYIVLLLLDLSFLFIMVVAGCCRYGRYLNRYRYRTIRLEDRCKRPRRRTRTTLVVAPCTCHCRTSHSSWSHVALFTCSLWTVHSTLVSVGSGLWAPSLGKNVKRQANCTLYGTSYSRTQCSRLWAVIERTTDRGVSCLVSFVDCSWDLASCAHCTNNL